MVESKYKLISFIWLKIKIICVEKDILCEFTTVIIT